MQPPFPTAFTIVPAQPVPALGASARTALVLLLATALIAALRRRAPQR